jgi:hypothetical protein
MPSGYSGIYTARWVAVFTSIQTLVIFHDLEVGVLTLYTDIAMPGNFIGNNFELQYDGFNVFKTFRMRSFQRNP